MTVFLVLLMLFQGSQDLMQEEQLATVIVYRGSSYGMQRFELWMGDTPLLKPMRNNISVQFKVPPGDLELLIKRTDLLQAENQYVIEVKAGVTYYLKAELEYNFLVTKLSLSVSNSKAYEKALPRLNKVVIHEVETSPDH